MDVRCAFTQLTNLTNLFELMGRESEAKFTQLGFCFRKKTFKRLGGLG